MNNILETLEKQTNIKTNTQNTTIKTQTKTTTKNNREYIIFNQGMNKNGNLFNIICFL